MVQIRVVSDSPEGREAGRAGIVVGTGFFVDSQGYVLTAAHVINKSRDGQIALHATVVSFKVAVLLDDSSTSSVHFSQSFTVTGATVVDIDDVHDVALLKASSIQTPVVMDGHPVQARFRTAMLDSRLPPEGQPLLVSGYPLNIPTLVTQNGMVASESYSYVQVPGARQETVDSILLDSKINPGNSGGPVYDSTSGSVVGICDAYNLAPLGTNEHSKVEIAPGEYLTQNAGIAIVVPIEYAIALLRKNAVSDFSGN